MDDMAQLVNVQSVSENLLRHWRMLSADDCFLQTIEAKYEVAEMK